VKGSIKLFDVAGISVKIHLTFFLLPLIFLVWGGFKSMVLVLIIFLCVTLHELTHSLVAMRFGIRVKDITLLPIGGVASMTRMPENPKQEFLISIAGPAFNVVFAVFLMVVFHYSPWMPAYILRQPEFGDSWLHMLAWVPRINIILAVFNLLPAFPMDGGRMLRAVLATRIDYTRATRIAVNIGHIFALIFAFIGFMYNHIFLILIAVFIYMTASAEESHVKVKTTLKDLRVRDVLNLQYTSLEKDTPLSRVFELIFHTHQEDFPIIEGGRMEGFVSRQDIINAMHSTGPDTKVGDIMRQDMPSASENDLLVNVQRVMEESGTRALPVKRRDNVIGIVTLEDIGRVYSIMAHRRGA